MPNVNRRLTERLPLQVPMDVFSGYRYVGRFRTRNIDPGGAFIETGNRALVHNGTIEVVIASPDAYGTVGRTQALVVRHTEEGLAISFRDYAPGFCQCMADIVDRATDVERFRHQTTARGGPP